MKKTGVLLLLWLCLSIVFLLALEAWTLADSVAANHITSVVRVAFQKEPGVFVWLAFSAGYLAGHLLWSGRKS